MVRTSGILVGSSPAFGRVREQILRISQLDATVCIEGETGTGKEMVAREIHYRGKRSDKPFVPVNCGALTDALVESELFGHERGAFTDAKAASIGLVSEAQDGTLFLDEVDALSLKAQAALLRFLQDGSYRRVGGVGSRHSEARIIVASNARLEELAEARLFRTDLLYRVNVLSIRLPALRQRGHDVLEIAQVLLARLSHHHQRPGAHFTPAAVAYMRSHNWPGNVRELDNAVQRAFLFTDADAIDMPAAQHAMPADAAPESATLGFRGAKQQAVDSFERDYLQRLLDQTRGNVTQAAALAGQDRSAFRRLLRRHGMRPSTAVAAGVGKPQPG